MKQEIKDRALPLSEELETWLQYVSGSDELSSEVVLALLADMAGKWLGQCYSGPEFSASLPDGLKVFHEWVTKSANYYHDHANRSLT